MASPKGLRNWKSAPKPRRRHYVLAAGFAVLLWLSLVGINLLWAPQSTHHHLCHDVSSICNDLLPECDGEHVALLRHACPVTCDSCARKPPTFECRDRRAECAAIAAAGRCDVEPLVYWRDCRCRAYARSSRRATTASQSSARCGRRRRVRAHDAAAEGDLPDVVQRVRPRGGGGSGRGARRRAKIQTRRALIGRSLASATPTTGDALRACACALCTQGGGGAAPAAASRAADADGSPTHATTARRGLRAARARARRRAR